MSEYRQMLRGTTLQLDAFTGLVGMRAYDTDRNEMRIFDGLTLGGFRLPNLTTVNAAIAAGLPNRLASDGAVFTTDLNLALANGFYRNQTTAANLPVPTTAGSLLVVCSNTTAPGDLMQMWTALNSNQTWVRIRSAGAFGSWIRHVDKTYGDTIYLAIGATAVNSTSLNGQLASFYTNIVARLGYTPVNKAGDTALGNMGITGTLTASGLVTAGSLSVTGVSNIAALAATSGAFSGPLTHAGATVWDSGNDGIGSGLDASMLDGVPSSFYGRRHVGSIVMMTGQGLAGLQILDGSLPARSTYPLLWTYASGTGNIAVNDGAWTEGQYSPGDGISTFRLPDYRGRFLRGLDTSRGIDPGRVIGSSQAQQIGNHIHNIDGVLTTGGALSNLVRTAAGLSAAAFPTGNPAGGGTEERPANLAPGFYVVTGG